jgi:hypothetical protein
MSGIASRRMQSCFFGHVLGVSTRRGEKPSAHGRSPRRRVFEMKWGQRDVVVGEKSDLSYDQALDLILIDR